MSREGLWVIRCNFYIYETPSEPIVESQGTSVYSVTWKDKGRTITIYPGASPLAILSPVRKENKP